MKTALSIIRNRNAGVSGKVFGANQWGKTHAVAFQSGVLGQATLGGALARMVEAWALYADAHQSRYESPIGEDGVLGDEWQKVGEALLGLLNGELGGLDGGTMDGMIREIMQNAVVKVE